MNPKPNFNIEPVPLSQVEHLYTKYHPYGSNGKLAVYSFAVMEDNEPIASFLWQPPRQEQPRTSGPNIHKAYWHSAGW